MSEESEACYDHLVSAIGSDIERSIASLGYPVGMGLAPSPEACTGAARQIVDRIQSAALQLLAEREPASS